MQTIEKNILERGAAFLQQEAIIARMDAQTQSDMQAGKKEFYLADFYMRKKLPASSGIIELTLPEDLLKVGVTNLNNAKLPHGTYMALTAVGMGYGFNSNGNTEVSLIRYASSEYLSTIPVKIMNSEFSLQNGDKGILRCRTKKFFANAYADFSSEANDENAVLLPTPKLIAFDKTMKAQLNFAADAGNLPAGGHYIELRLQGVYVGDRS